MVIHNSWWIYALMTNNLKWGFTPIVIGESIRKFHDRNCDINWFENLIDKPVHLCCFCITLTPIRFFHIVSAISVSVNTFTKHYWNWSRYRSPYEGAITATTNLAGHISSQIKSWTQRDIRHCFMDITTNQFRILLKSSGFREKIINVKKEPDVFATPCSQFEVNVFVSVTFDILTTCVSITTGLH